MITSSLNPDVVKTYLSNPKRLSTNDRKALEAHVKKEMAQFKRPKVQKGGVYGSK